MTLRVPSTSMIGCPCSAQKAPLLPAPCPAGCSCPPAGPGTAAPAASPAGPTSSAAPPGWLAGPPAGAVPDPTRPPGCAPADVPPRNCRTEWPSPPPAQAEMGASGSVLTGAGPDLTGAGGKGGVGCQEGGGGRRALMGQWQVLPGSGASCWRCCRGDFPASRRGLVEKAPSNSTLPLHCVKSKVRLALAQRSREQCKTDAPSQRGPWL